MRKSKKVKEVTPLVYPMYELSNGDIVQFMAYGWNGYEVYKQFNDPARRFYYDRDNGFWYAANKNVMKDVKIERKIK